MNSSRQVTLIWNHFLSTNSKSNPVERKEVAQQIKLGAFVLVGIALFLAAVFLIGSENNIFSRTFVVAAEFKNVEGLKHGDNVWLSGVKIGTVGDVEIISEGKVIVTLNLRHNQNQFIKKDATASIGSDGLVGNKIVVVRPGMAPEVIAERDTINTLSPPDTQELINIAKDVGENTRSLTHDLSTIARRINEGQGIVGEFLNDGDFARELRLTVSSLQATGANTAQASAELHQLIYELRAGTGLLPTLISDTAYANTFREALNNVREFSATAGEASREIEALSRKLNDDDNALGVLLSDRDVAARLRNTVENAELASQKLDENMEALQHNFLFRGYFRRQERRQEKEAASSASSRKD